MSVRWPVMSAAEVRAAEQAMFDDGMAPIDLMERAGEASVRIIETHFDRQPTLVLCGPGNNGGDGYVIARLLAQRGWDVTVAAPTEPRTETARLARQRWEGPIEAIGAAGPMSLIVDALFGIGLARPLDPEMHRRLAELVEAADHAVAVDVPSGLSSDGRPLGQVPRFDITIALGTLKPVHVREPGNALCGRVVVGDIGLIAPHERATTR